MKKTLQEEIGSSFVRGNGNDKKISVISQLSVKAGFRKRVEESEQQK